MNDVDNKIVRFVFAMVCFLIALAGILITTIYEIGADVIESNPGIKFLAIFFSIIISLFIGILVYTDWSWMQ